jgi:hypothetical protein
MPDTFRPDIFVPYTGADVIKVDGRCYKLQEVVSGPNSPDIVIEEDYETCEDCETDGGVGALPEFISQWDTTQPGSASDTVILPITAGPTIDWGDGTINNANTHSYSTPGIYTITSSDPISDFRFNDLGDKEKLIDISNFGSLEISAPDMFRGCVNLVLTAVDIPSITTNDLSGTFYGATSFDGILHGWDISNIVDMTDMFGGGSGMSTESYDAALTIWSSLSVQSSVSFGAGTSTYTLGSSAESSKDSLETTYLWVIVDGGGV